MMITTTRIQHPTTPPVLPTKNPDQQPTNIAPVQPGRKYELHFDPLTCKIPPVDIESTKSSCVMRLLKRFIRFITHDLLDLN